MTEAQILFKGLTREILHNRAVLAAILEENIYQRASRLNIPTEEARDEVMARVKYFQQEFLSYIEKAGEQENE